MRGSSKWVLVGLLVLALLLGWRYFTGAPTGALTQPRIPYTQFKSIVTRGEVAKVTMRDREIMASLKQAQVLVEGKPAVQGLRTTIPTIGDDALLPALEKAHVVVSVSPSGGSGFSQILIGLLPILVIVAIYMWLWRGVFRNMTGGLGGGGGIDKFLDRPATRERKQGPKVTFNDVAGQESAKRDVAELLDYLRDPGKYRELGADIPHGVLLVGPPGTGKTLLARALAGEAEVPFFSISASAFIEVFVGVGASRVRKMFDGAKKNAPAIIFIDELDAIGRARGTGIGGGHDEREQTLNQILAEMDGFEGHEAVIVLAATNRPDVLDPALLRPGRFDRHVTLELPDKDARMQILKVHTREVPLAADVDLDAIAAGTPGFSGADLKNLVNEAAMYAARENATHVTARHFDEMRDKVMMGAVRSLAIQPEERHRLAVHESGHTLAAHFLPHADPLHKVTIIPRGMALGATQLMPEEERHTLPEDYLKDRLAMMLAGRTSEKVLLGTVSSGADDDIRQATKLARAMVARWGMSEDIGPIDLRESEEHPFLGREIAQPRHFSDQTAHEVDSEVAELLREAEARDAKLIGEHRAGLDKLIASLEEKETLASTEIEACLGPGRPRKAPVRAEEHAKAKAAAKAARAAEPPADETPEPPHESPASKRARRVRSA
jgi:cell division protease FtsH